MHAIGEYIRAFALRPKEMAEVFWVNQSCFGGAAGHFKRAGSFVGAVGSGAAKKGKKQATKVKKAGEDAYELEKKRRAEKKAQKEAAEKAEREAQLKAAEEKKQKLEDDEKAKKQALADQAAAAHEAQKQKEREAKEKAEEEKRKKELAAVARTFNKKLGIVAGKETTEKRKQKKPSSQEEEDAATSMFHSLGLSDTDKLIGQKKELNERKKKAIDAKNAAEAKAKLEERTKKRKERARAWLEKNPQKFYDLYTYDPRIHHHRCRRPKLVF